jgi:hypothetical protein
MPVTIHDIQQLLSTNEALLRRMADLGIKAANVGTSLVTNGTPAPEIFVHELAEIGRVFAALRRESLEAAASLGLPLPSEGSVNSATVLKEMLEALVMAADALERHARVAAARQSALKLLEEVAMLVHVDHAAFEPLELCQQQAKNVRAAVEQSSEPSAEAIAPFGTLLHFINSHRDLDDEEWGAAHDSISGTFGKSLALAAGRGRLLPRRHSAATPLGPPQ